MRKLLSLLAVSGALCAPAHAGPAQTRPPAAAAGEVTPEKHALARRMIELERGGLDQLAILRLAAGGTAGIFQMPVDPELVKSFEQAYAESGTELAAIRDKGAEIYARAYTEEELRAVVEHLGSPIGRAIHRKRLAALPLPPRDLTAEERAVDAAFAESAVGASLRAKKAQVAVEFAMATVAINSLIIDRAVEIHCRRTGKCPKAEGPAG